jgi:ABC-2 type transport system permease protein
MNLWRLEWLRLTRTRRLVALLGVYLFFGLTGPLTARYLSQILASLGTEGVRVEFPDPTPADGIAQYVGNISQIGLLVVVMVAASALAFDARREMAVFLRTRVAGIRAIVLPAYAVTTGGAVAALLLGSLAAWYETAVLLGGLPAGRLLAGIGFGAVFLAFAIAAVALVAALVRGVLATAGVTLVALLAMAILGNVGDLGRWLPTTLAGAMAGLVRDTTLTDYLPATAVTLGLTAAALAGAIVLGERREL